jgi:hypothetical protein
MNNRKFLDVASRVLMLGILTASLVAFGWVALGVLPSINSLGGLRWGPLVGAITLQLLMLFVLMFLWERLLAMLWRSGSSPEMPPRSSLYTAYSRSWLTRYIPGHIWSLGGRALLVNKLGVPIRFVTRSMAVEVLFTYTLVAIIGGALLVAEGFNVPAGGVLLVLGFGVFTSVLFASQKLLNRGIPVQPAALQKARSLIFGDLRFAPSDIAWGILAYGVYASGQLGVVVLIAASLVDLNASLAAVIAGAWGISLTAGWILFLAPVGLGVRDGLAFALFSQVLDAPVAALIVAGSRVTTLAIDLFFVGAVELLALSLNPGRPGLAGAAGQK